MKNIHYEHAVLIIKAYIIVLHRHRELTKFREKSHVNYYRCKGRNYPLSLKRAQYNIVQPLKLHCRLLTKFYSMWLCCKIQSPFCHNASMNINQYNYFPDRCGNRFLLLDVYKYCNSYSNEKQGKKCRIQTFSNEWINKRKFLNDGMRF